MTEGIFGTVLVLLVGFISWLVGFILGLLSGKNKAKEWIQKNGCYLCQEKYRNPLEWD